MDTALGLGCLSMNNKKGASHVKSTLCRDRQSSPESKEDVHRHQRHRTLDNSITSADPGLTLGAAAQAGDKIIFAGGIGEGYYGDESSDRAEVIAFE